MARIVGNVVSTACHPSMKGRSALLCQQINELEEPQGEPFVSVANHSAGIGDKVLITTDGSYTMELLGDNHTPLRNLIVGIVDE